MPFCAFGAKRHWAGKNTCYKRQVDINLDTESSEIRLSGFRKEVKELAEKIKSIVSDHGVFEGKLAGRYQYEGSRQSFLKLLTNQSSTDKVIPSLYHNYVIALLVKRS